MMFRAQGRCALISAAAVSAVAVCILLGGTARGAESAPTAAPPSFAGSPAADGALSRQAVESLMQEMAARGASFSPERLSSLGPAGLKAVLDCVFPETAPIEEDEPDDAMIAGLLEEMRDDQYQTREAATERLLKLGPAARKTALRLAQQSDAEVSWRAIRVLRAWDDQRRDDMTRYSAALAACFAQINDPPRLEILADRTRRVLELGAPSGGKANIMRDMVRTLYAAKDDRWLDRLAPVFKKAANRADQVLIQWLSQAMAREAGRSDMNRAVAAGEIAAARGGSSAEPPAAVFVPRLLIAALQSDQTPVQLVALQAVPTKPDGPNVSALREQLDAMFAGTNDTVKLRAARPLIVAFGHAGAYDYLLEQAAQRENAARRQEALSMMAQLGPNRGPLPPKAAAVLPELLKQQELGHARVMAAGILGSHTGKAVLDALIPALADNYQPLAQEAERRLMQYPDKGELLKALEQAAKENQRLKDAAGRIGEQIRSSEAQP